MRRAPWGSNLRPSDSRAKANPRDVAYWELCDPNRILFNEAVELLRVVREGKGVDAERAQQFARAVVESMELGRKAMAVLEGGLFAGAPLVELAETVLRESGRSDAPRRESPFRWS